MDEVVKHSLMQATLANPWKHDSDSLTYQEELKMYFDHYGQHPFNLLQKNRTGRIKQSNDDDENATEDYVYYSAGVESQSNAKKNCNVLHMDTCQMLSRRSYSELHHDPNWRMNLGTNDRFTKYPEMSIEEYQPEEKCSQRLDMNQRVKDSESRYIIYTGQDSVVETPHLPASKADQPYHPHSQAAKISSVATLSCSRNYLQNRAPHAELSRSSGFITVKESGNISQRQLKEKCEKCFFSTLPKLTDDVHTLNSQICHQQVPRHTKQGPSQTKNMSKSTLISPEVIWNKRLIKDLVESNKITLGCSTSGCGSYVRVHALKQEMTHKTNKINQKERKGTKAQGKELFHLSQQHQPPAPGEGQDSLFQLACHLGHSLWNHVQLPFLHTKSTKIDSEPNQQNLRSSSDHYQRKGVSKLSISCHRGWQNLGPDEVHIKHVSQQFPRTPAITLSQDQGFYSVLPPIKKPATGKEQELSPGQSVNTTCLIHRNGYLSQMEKQKQLRDRDPYKVHSLEDKKLNSNLRVWGPDYTTTENTNKKIRIPLLLPNDPEGINKKDPRTKALEYAKTIAKPPLQSQPKQRQKQPPEGFTEHMPCLQGLDVSQLAILELLRKRHEVEKQALAHFRKEHSV